MPVRGVPNKSGSKRDRLLAQAIAVKPEGPEEVELVAKDAPPKRVQREVALDEIRPDPKNPRGLVITLKDLQRPAEEQSTLAMQQEVEAIQKLADGIRKEGVRNPIETYRENSIYRIVAGERRYWACRLLETQLTGAALEDLLRVPIFQYPDVPAHLRRVQLTENYLRENLPLPALINNVLIAIEEAEANGVVIDSVGALQRELLLKKNDAEACFNLARKHPKVLPHVQAGRVSSMRALRYLLQQSDAIVGQMLTLMAQPSFRPEKLYEQITGLRDTTHLRDSAGADQDEKAPARKALGRPSKYVATLKLNGVAGKRIYELVRAALPDLNLEENVNWGDRKQAGEALKRMLAVLEK